MNAENNFKEVTIKIPKTTCGMVVTTIYEYKDDLYKGYQMSTKNYGKEQIDFIDKEMQELMSNKN